MSLPPPKEIRFVPNDGQPPRKRHRVTAACLTCRKRKVRCSGERPECSTCADNSQSCAGYTCETSRKATAGDKRGAPDNDRSYSRDCRKTSSTSSPAPTASFPYQDPNSDPGSQNASSLTGAAQLEQQFDYLTNRWVNELPGYTQTQPNYAQTQSNQSNIRMPPPASPPVPANTIELPTDLDFILSMNARYMPGTPAFQMTPGPR